MLKDSLKIHILKVFSSLQIEHVPYEVYECGVDSLPEWANHVQLTHEFMVCCEQNFYKDKLQRFLYKEIYQNEKYMYWFEGEKIVDINQDETETAQKRNVTEASISYLKSETRLLKWLDDFIFRELGAEYAPDFQCFGYNLDSTKDKNLIYLGTYFPRSYAESFCIFDNIFQYAPYKQIIAQKEKIKILSVGCGTGGDLAGLLTIIEKYCSDTVSTINILAIDGNKDAITILEKIIIKFQENFSKRIVLVAEHAILSSITDIDLSRYCTKYDFILSFKMVCEIILAGKGAYNNSYYDFVVKFLPMLSNEGLCVLLDVTIKAENGIYLPIIVNQQVNQALRDLKNYQTLLPRSCNLYEAKCDKKCFTQQQFSVTHLNQSKNISNVVYRVIAPKFLTGIMPTPQYEVRYITNKSKFYNSTSEGLCAYSAHYTKAVDAYKLISKKKGIQG